MNIKDILRLDLGDKHNIAETIVCMALNEIPAIFTFGENLDLKKFNKWVFGEIIYHSSYSYNNVIGSEYLRKLTPKIYLNYSVSSEDNYIFNISFIFSPQIERDEIIRLYINPISKMKKKFKQEASFNIIKYSKEYDAFMLEPVVLDRKDSTNIELNYGKEFCTIDKQIQKSLKSSRNGLYLFHGVPGTGKTTYIRHLITNVDKKFIYIPNSMFDSIISPNFISFLQTIKESVLIIEDAERLIQSRDLGSSNAISTLLNMTDGLLSDFLKFQIIATFNMDKSKIDEALRRSGRLKIEHDFKPLCSGDAQKLADHLGQTIVYSGDTTLSDIYNEVVNIKKEKIIGF